ncbi:MAG TPA: M20/M25/M40 family metallo-hydrolase [Thermoanaerobaculia bacterium]|nr:M20/M25/M40 family metallo-hydrolase [Thermoanaerobaculia bacterium]
MALLLAACREAPEPPAPRPVVRVQGEAINIQQAMAHLRALAASPRPTGSPAEARAAAYIEKSLAAEGYRVERQPVPLPGGESANVVAFPELDPSVDRYLLVGAHYDTVVGSPGANDNASGVAVLLELARVLAARPARLPVVFVAFGAEEGRPGPQHQSLGGSRHYAQGLSPAAARNLAAMINLDMIGRGDVLLSTLRINMKRGVHQRMLGLAGRLGVPAREHFTPQVSDSVPFASRGIETGWLWTGVEPSYHSPLDTPEKVTPETLDWAGRLTLATIRSYE